MSSFFRSTVVLETSTHVFYFGILPLQHPPEYQIALKERGDEWMPGWVPRGFTSVPGCFMFKFSYGEFTFKKSTFHGSDFCEHATFKSRLLPPWLPRALTHPPWQWRAVFVTYKPDLCCLTQILYASYMCLHTHVPVMSHRLGGEPSVIMLLKYALEVYALLSVFWAKILKSPNVARWWQCMQLSGGRGRQIPGLQGELRTAKRSCFKMEKACLKTNKQKQTGKSCYMTL